MRLLFPLFILLALAGCQGQKDETQSPPPPSSPTKGRVLFRGHLIAADDPGGWFRPCGMAHRLQASDGTEGGLWALVENTAGGVEIPIYAEFHGVFDGIHTPPILIVEELTWLAAEGGDCLDTPSYNQLVASGTEPFWQLTVGSRGAIRWQDPEQNIDFGDAGLRIGAFLHGESASTTFEATSQDGRRLELVLSHDACRGAMADAWHPYSVDVTLDGKTVQGCGRPGLLPVPGSGEYSTELPAADSPGRLIRLTLTDHGEATLSMDYQNDEPAILEQGLWYLDPSRANRLILQIIEKDGDLHSDRLIFDREGFSLRLADYDTSHFGGEGLILDRVEP